MTRYEAIYQYEEQIREALRQAVKDTVGNPNAVEQVYVWEDGEIEYLYGTATGWLQPKDSEQRQLFHVATIRGVDLTEVAFCEELPEDGDRCAELLEEAEEWYVSDYDDREAYYELLEDAEQEEKMRREDEEALASYYG